MLVTDSIDKSLFLLHAASLRIVSRISLQTLFSASPTYSKSDICPKRNTNGYEEDSGGRVVHRTHLGPYLHADAAPQRAIVEGESREGVVHVEESILDEHAYLGPDLASVY